MFYQVKVYCARPERNQLNWFDNVFIGFQVLGILVMKNRQSQVLAKAKEGLLHREKYPVLHQRTPLLSIVVFVHLRTSRYVFNPIYVCH